MGGYGAYRLALAYPEVFAQAAVLAGPPTCGVQLLPDVDIPGNLDPDSHCAREGDTLRLLVNARWLPFVIAHGLLDELVLVSSVLFQVHELDRLGYRYRFTVYPTEDHIRWVFKDDFDDPVSHMGTGLRPTPGTSPSRGMPQALERHRPQANRAGSGVVAVGPDGRTRKGPPTAGKGPPSTRDRTRGPGPDADRAASSRIQTRPRPLTRAVHRAALANRAAHGSLPSLALNLSHVAGLPPWISPGRGYSFVEDVDDQRRDRHGGAGHTCRGSAIGHKPGAARRSAARSVSGGSGGSTHHHVDQIRRRVQRAVRGAGQRNGEPLSNANRASRSGRSPHTD